MDCQENEGLLSQLVLEARFKHIPAALFAELTRRCNLRCRHCYLTDYDGDDELTTREWLDALDQTAALGGFILTISGGEALLRDDLEEIASHAVNAGFFTRLFTNGLLVDEERIKKLERVNWQAVEVSLHGASPQSHDALTGTPGSFARTVHGMRLLRAAGITLIMKSNINKLNMHELPAMLDLAKELDAKLRFSPIISVKEDGGTQPLVYRLTEEEMYATQVILRQAGKIVMEQPPKFLDDGENPSAATAIACSAGRGTLEIHANGDVTPCVELLTYLGNIRLQSIESIWYNNPRVERLLQLGEATIPECLHCRYSYHCIRCPGSALGESGSALLPVNIECQAARAIGKAEEELWTKRNM